MSASPARMRSWYRFKCRQVDGVGEVRDQQLAALGFEARPVRSEVSKLMIPPGALLIERRVDFGGEVPVVVVADRDVCPRRPRPSVRRLGRGRHVGCSWSSWTLARSRRSKRRSCRAGSSRSPAASATHTTPKITPAEPPKGPHPANLTNPRPPETDRSPQPTSSGRSSSREFSACRQQRGCGMLRSTV